MNVVEDESTRPEPLDLDLDGRSTAEPGPEADVPEEVVALLGGDEPEDLREPAIDPDATPPVPVVTREQVELLLGDELPAFVQIRDPDTAPKLEPPPLPGEPVVDPRIRARRLDVLRAEGRRRLRIGVLAAAIVLLVAVAYGVTRSPLFAISDIAVTGAARTDPEDLEGVLRTVRGNSLVWVDLDELKARLEALPWVKRASVVRDWPRGLTVDVGERRPVAIYAADDGAWRVVDGEGRVLVSSEGRPVGFPEIIGDPTAVERGQVAEGVAAAAGVAAVLPPELAAQLKAIRLDPVSGLVLELAPKGFVVLGTPEDVRGKLLRAMTVLERCPPGTFEVMDAQVSPVTLAPVSACPSLTRPAS